MSPDKKASKTVHFSEVASRIIPAPSPALAHHHITVTLPLTASTQLAHSFFPETPREVRVHFWAPAAGFPASALLFCAHFDYEETVYYNNIGGIFEHSPELVKEGPPSSIACGSGQTAFMLSLITFLWGELQEPVQSLSALRLAVMAHVTYMLEN